MGWGNGNLGGGASVFNFKVIGGTSRPNNAKENTIWANVENFASYIFSAFEPKEKIPDMLWFKTSNSSNISFNVLKKNSIILHPSACYQNIDGEWITIPAQIYQNNKWIDWTTYLYNMGDEFENLTGGWVSKALKNESGGTAKAPTIEKGNSSLSMVGNVRSGGVVQASNKIDLTDYTTLKFNGTIKPASSTGFWATICVWSDFGSTYQENLAAYFDATKETTDEQTIDISDLSGEHYVGFALYGSSSIEMKMLSIE